jgi:hypothetical protein
LGQAVGVDPEFQTVRRRGKRRMTESYADIHAALTELGFTGSDDANFELLCDRLVRSGWSKTNAEFTRRRVKRRYELIDAAAVHFSRAGRVEALVRMLVEDDPPSWRAIWRCASSLVRMTLRRRAAA